MGEKIDNVKKNTGALLDAIMEVGLEVNPKKTKYMLMSRSQKIGQKHSIKLVKRSLEDAAKIQISVKNTNKSKSHARKY
jgi:hypothetical protein